MNQDSENFEALRKLLALKRHEQPPPGYFDRLPHQIRARLETGESELPWWEKLASGFSFRPAMVYAFGLTVCSALAVGSIYFARVQPAQVNAQRPPADSWKPMAPAPAFASQTESAPPRLTLHAPNWMGSTNPISDPRQAPSLFEPLELKTVPASFEQGN